jgi:hypothetical protein
MFRDTQYFSKILTIVPRKISVEDFSYLVFNFAKFGLNLLIFHDLSNHVVLDGNMLCVAMVDEILFSQQW